MKSSQIIQIWTINEHTFTNNDVDQSTTVSLSVQSNVHRCFIKPLRYYYHLLLLLHDRSHNLLPRCYYFTLLPPHKPNTLVWYSPLTVYYMCALLPSPCVLHAIRSRGHLNVVCLLPRVVYCCSRTSDHRLDQYAVVSHYKFLLFFKSIVSSPLFIPIYVSHYASIMCILLYVIFSSLWLLL